nr:hypothetical protein [Tanacetum cinerariifolium]
MNTDFSFKVLQPPTRVTDSTSGYITYPRFFSSYPNLILASSNVLEVFTFRVSFGDKLIPNDSVLDGVSGAVLELTCSMRVTLSPFPQWQQHTFAIWNGMVT